MRTMSATLLLAGALAPATAATTPAFNDLRVGVNFTESDYEEAVGGSAEERDWESTLTFTGSWVASSGLGLLGGFIYGAQGLGTFREDEDGAREIDYQSAVVRLQLGYGFALIEGLQVEGLPYIGAGWAELEETTGSTSVSDTDIEFQYGIQANLVYTWTSRLQAGVGLAYGLSETDFDDIGGTEVEIDQEDLVASIFVGLRI